MPEKLKKALIQVSLKAEKDKQAVWELLSTVNLFYEDSDSQVLESQPEVDQFNSSADIELLLTFGEVFEEDIQELVLPFIRGIAEVRSVELLSIKEPTLNTPVNKEPASARIREAVFSFDVEDEPDKLKQVSERVEKVIDDMKANIENYRGIKGLIPYKKDKANSGQEVPVAPGQVRLYLHLTGDFLRGAVDRLQSTEFSPDDKFPHITNPKITIVEFVSK